MYTYRTTEGKIVYQMKIFHRVMIGMYTWCTTEDKIDFFVMKTFHTHRE